MLLHIHRKPVKYHLCTISVLVFQLILTHLCRGQSQLVDSPQRILTTLAEDIILPCLLEPKRDATALTLEWTRPDLDPRFVHVWRSGEELVSKKHQAFKGRTSLFIDELKNGNISLRLSRVKFSDAGTYRCFIPALDKQSFVQLVIASNAISSPVVSLAGLDQFSSGVVLQCESKGCYPEPEVLWLDGEGNVLSAGPTETVRGPDDLYTVSGRLTVDKTQRNRFTCRVQQTNINQSRETHIHVSDHFFNVQSSIFMTTIGLAVSLAVVFILSLLSIFILWKKQSIIRFQKKHEDENVQRKCYFNNGKTKDQVSIEEEKATEQLITDNVANNETELHKLHEENQETENNLQTLKKKLEEKNKELETLKAQLDQWWFWRSSKEICLRKKMEMEKEVENLKKQLETESQIKEMKINQESADEKWKAIKKELEQTQAKLNQTKTHLDEVLKENIQLKEQKQTAESDRQQLQKELETMKKEAITMEIDDSRQYISLLNQLDRDQQLGGWMLKVQINNEKPITYKFDSSVSLKARGSVKLCVPGHCTSNSPIELEWKDLKPWNRKCKLQYSLIKST